MDIGEDGEEKDDNNPLSRAVSRLFEDGQPFKRLSMCFCAENLESGQVNKRLWWLGVFIHSQADRVVFFPGFKDSAKHVHTYQGNKLRWDQILDFDHITLDRNHTYTHITGPKSKGHLGRLPTLDLGQNRFLWFGMSLSGLDALRLIYRRTSLVMGIPSADSARRIKIFNESRQDAAFQIVQLHPDAAGVASQGFLHFSFVVGPKGFEQHNGEEHCFPHGSPFLFQPLPESLSKIPIRIHRISLSDSIDIQVTSAWLPGKLKVPVTLTMMRRTKQ